MYLLYTMSVFASITFSPESSTATLPVMARQKAEGDRYFVRLTKDEKRILDFLAVNAGASSSEAYGGRLLGELLLQRWASFKPELPGAKPAKPTPRPRRE